MATACIYLIIGVLSLLAAACAPTPTSRRSTEIRSTAATATWPPAKLTPHVPATFAPSEIPNETPEPDFLCAETAGQIVQAELVDERLPRSLPYRIYLPPCAKQHFGDLPTLYLLHGLARTDSQWEELGAGEIANRLISSEAAPPFLIVMPWERKGLDFEDALVNYLVPHVQSEYGASTDSKLRSIGGISRGAGWALRMGLKYPELFESVGLHSPAVLIPDTFMIPDWIEAAGEEELPLIWIDIGDRDPLRLALPELTDVLDDLELEYSLIRYPGEHIETYWSGNVDEYLGWYVLTWSNGERTSPPQ